jgi:hypothetical protein
LAHRGVERKELEEFVEALGDGFFVEGGALGWIKGFPKGSKGPKVLG